jgi:hypothetical protein
MLHRFHALGHPPRAEPQVAPSFPRRGGRIHAKGRAQAKAVLTLSRDPEGEGRVLDWTETRQVSWRERSNGESHAKPQSRKEEKTQREKRMARSSECLVCLNFFRCVRPRNKLFRGGQDQSFLPCCPASGSPIPNSASIRAIIEKRRKVERARNSLFLSLSPIRWFTMRPRKPVHPLSERFPG